jgi:hexokinase
MASRVHTLLQHVSSTPTEGFELRALKQRVSLAHLQSKFSLSYEQLKEMQYYMMHEMLEGLVGKPSSLKMLPSYVYKQDTKHCTGVYYALDLGGTNFRVIRMVLREGALINSNSSFFTIPKDIMVGGTSSSLFGFIANSLLNFLNEKGSDDKTRPNIPLGFTFSFPVQQHAIASGTLIKWTKEFTTSGVEGKDVVALLQKALRKANINMKVVALCNDTVGTLIARFFHDRHTEMGVILGTGANACYWEKSRNVTKDPIVVARGDQETVVNMEFGGFDSQHVHCLPVTDFDISLDKNSANPGDQRFEKMISGYYLGEIARLIIVDLSKNGSLPSGLAAKIAKPYAFESKDMSEISADHVPGLAFTRTLIREKFGFDLDFEPDRHLIRIVCTLVRNRAAQLAGMAISAALAKSEKVGNATIAVDGSVYEKTPSVRALLKRTMWQLLGQDSGVRFMLQKEGSGFGAGFIAALSV